jgi:hypothetical protein
MNTPVTIARYLSRYIREAELFRRYRKSGQTVAGFGASKADFKLLCHRVRRRESENGWTLDVMRTERKWRAKN